MSTKFLKNGLFFVGRGAGGDGRERISYTVPGHGTTGGETVRSPRFSTSLFNNLRRASDVGVLPSVLLEIIVFWNLTPCRWEAPFMKQQVRLGPPQPLVEWVPWTFNPNEERFTSV